MIQLYDIRDCHATKQSPRDMRCVFFAKCFTHVANGSGLLQSASANKVMQMSLK